jgi:hypothetical protein
MAFLSPGRLDVGARVRAIHHDGEQHSRARTGADMEAA